jgi:hypothetical protein
MSLRLGALGTKTIRVFSEEAGFRSLHGFAKFFYTELR